MDVDIAAFVLSDLVSREVVAVVRYVLEAAVAKPFRRQTRKRKLVDVDVSLVLYARVLEAETALSRLLPCEVAVLRRQTQCMDVTGWRSKLRTWTSMLDCNTHCST